MINAIVAIDENWGIGSKNKLLAHIPEDMQLFKSLTTGYTVVMGRKTWESLPKTPLPNRYNVIVTSISPACSLGDGVYCMTLEEVEKWLATTKTEVFVIGGGMLYEELLPYCECVYVTKIYHAYDNVDTYFPNIDNFQEWEIETVSEMKEHEGIKYQFYTYRKKCEQ